MINKIIASLVFVCLLLAISIKLIGLANNIDITHVSISGPFLSLMKNTSIELSRFKIAIPDIPTIPDLEETSGAWVILDVLVHFVNGLVHLLNFIILVLNTAIQLIQFLVILLKNIVIFRNDLIPNDSVATTIV